MKKEFKFFGITWLVGFILFNAVTFLIPNVVLGVSRFDKPVFWITYALITATYIGQFIISYKFMKAGMKKKFLKISLLQTGYAAIIASSVVGIVFMIIPVIPTWIGAIVCLLIAGYYTIACVKASVAADVISSIDDKVKEKTAFIKNATVDVENILARATIETFKTEIKKVYEALKYSDPMSTGSLREIEKDIETKILELKAAVSSNSESALLDIVKEALILIKERNAKCKLLK